MSPEPEKSAGSKRKRINREIFGWVSILAVIMSTVLIFLSLHNSNLNGGYIPDIDPTAPGDTSMGSPDAPVTIVEFTDFQCAHCQQYALTIAPDLDEVYIETGRVRMEHKFVNGYGQESFYANVASLCAAEQGQFWPYYHLLMQQRAFPTADDLTIEKLQSLAQQLGLNMDTFNASLFSGKFEERVNQDNQESIDLGITAVPVFYINGVRMDGASSLQDFSDIIDPILEDLGY